jgi:hypothetical protein
VLEVEPLWLSVKLVVAEMHEDTACDTTTSPAGQQTSDFPLFQLCHPRRLCASRAVSKLLASIEQLDDDT